ncbi:MAG: hypothetical protein AAFX10_08435, partial [Pseudomonadota bacterium]
MPLVARLAAPLRLILVSIPLIAISTSCAQEEAVPANSHAALVELFKEWREFESPPLLDGAPDYTAEQFEKRTPEYAELRARLDAFEIDDWTIEH